MQFIAIKIDVVRSRRVANRQQLQDTIFQAVSTANERYVSNLASQFAVTHGDEIQGMIAANQADVCLILCEHFIDQLHPQKIRIGVGLGPLATKLQPTAIGMDGQAWHRAQSAIQRARGTRATFVLHGSDASTDQDLNAIIDYLLSHRLEWTANQRQAVQLVQELGSQQTVASQLGISTAAVSKRLTGCMWDKYRALHETAQRMLQRYVAGGI